MSLVDSGKVTAVELDLKDESGVVGLRRGRPAGGEDGRGAGGLRSRGGRRPPPLEGRARHRPARRLPRPDPRGLGVRSTGSGSRSSRHPAATPTRATAASRTSPTRPSASTTSTSPRRPSRPASTRSSTTTCAGRTGRSSTMRFPGLEGRPRTVDRRLPPRDPRAAPDRDLPRRLRLRRRGHAARRRRPEHPDDGARARLRLADGLPVTLDARRVRRQQPERPAVRHRARRARGLPEAGARHRRAGRPVAPGLLARLRRTGRRRCGPRSTPPPSSASTSSSSGTRSCSTPPRRSTSSLRWRPSRTDRV